MLTECSLRRDGYAGRLCNQIGGEASRMGQAHSEPCHWASRSTALNRQDAPSSGLGAAESPLAAQRAHRAQREPRSEGRPGPIRPGPDSRTSPPPNTPLSVFRSISAEERLAGRNALAPSLPTNEMLKAQTHMSFVPNP